MRPVTFALALLAGLGIASALPAPHPSDSTYSDTASSEDGHDRGLNTTRGDGGHDDSNQCTEPRIRKEWFVIIHSPNISWLR